MSVAMGWWRILLAVCATATAAQNPLPKASSSSREEPGYKIAGTAVNAVTGARLSGVKVTIADTRARARRIETITDEGGHFAFGGLPVGKYALQGTRSGYLASAYEQHEQFSTAIVTGPEFETGKLVLRLMPMATIAGRVVDEAGDSVRSARVQLYVEDHNGGMSRVVSAGGAMSDDRGYFDIGVLRPGTYFVSVNAKPWYAVHPPGENSRQGVSPALNVAYPTTFFGGATESEAAVPIELKGGERREIEIRLSPVPALRLVFRVPEEGGFEMPTLQKHIFDSVQALQLTEMHLVKPGVFELAGVPAGRYDVKSGSKEPGDVRVVSEVNLTHDGQDLSEFKGEALGSLKVTVRVLGGEPLPGQWALGLRDARQTLVALQPGQASAQVTFEAVKAGKYGIVFLAPGKRYAVERIVEASGEVAGLHEVDIAAGASMEITAEFVEGEVRIEGVAEKKGKPVAGVMVALVPSNPEANVDLFRRDQSDFDGTFTLRAVVPGTYTIVAVENAWEFDWMTARVLARYVQHGQNVTIGEKMMGMLHLPEPVEVQGR